MLVTMPYEVLTHAFTFNNRYVDILEDSSLSFNRKGMYLIR